MHNRYPELVPSNLCLHCKAHPETLHHLTECSRLNSLWNEKIHDIVKLTVQKIKENWDIVTAETVMVKAILNNRSHIRSPLVTCLRGLTPKRMKKIWRKKIKSSNRMSAALTFIISQIQSFFREEIWKN